MCPYLVFFFIIFGIGVQPSIPQNVTTDVKKNNAPAFLQIKPLVKHVLSKELQTYYVQTAKIIKNGKEEEFDEALLILGIDQGISALAPYFVQLIFDECFLNLQNCALLMRLLRFLEALLRNPRLVLEPYVIPSFLLAFKY